VAPGGDGDLQLGADAVVGGDQQGVAVAGRLQVEEAAEAAEAGVRPAAGGRAGQRLDGLDQRVARIDVDAGILVGQRVVARIPACYGFLRSHGVCRENWRFGPLCRAKIENPGRFAMWFRRTSGTLAAALGITALALLGCGAAWAQGAGDVFTVRSVAVDETAATAADARQTALAVGQRRAFRRLIDRLVPEDQQPLIPEVDATALQFYVRDFSVENERTSAVRYLADLTFRFDPEQVRSLLGGAGIAFAETRSKPVVVLPIFSGPDAGPTLWLETNPWRDVWAQRPGDDGLVPLTVPIGDLEDLAAIDAPKALAGDAGALRAIAARYGAEDVLVTVATLNGDPEAGSGVLQVETRRYVDGSAGSTQRDRLVQVSGEPYEGFLERAAARIDNAVQEAWKQQYLLQFGNQRTILVFVPLEGLDDWLTVRRRLEGVPAIQQTGLAALSRKEAQLEITFLGDEQRLSRALSQRDLFLALRPDSNWELTRRDKPRPPLQPSSGGATALPPAQAPLPQ
jgi:hypothetical protein